MLRRLLLSLACMTVAMPLVAAHCVAQLTTSEDASVLLFPFIVADGQHDTVVQLVNGAPRVTFVHCVYTPGGAGGANQELGFDLVLVTRQPTHWVASTGRPLDPSDDNCDRNMTACDGAGFDPGSVPALPEGFQGDLLCVQVDRSRAPFSGNALRGSATLLDTDSGDIAKYAAVGLPGLAFNDADNTLCLGGEESDTCPRGAEYAACPRTWLLEQRSEGAAPPGVGSGLASRSDLILETCSRRAGTGAAHVQMFVTNEFEQRLSTTVDVARWMRVALADLQIFTREVTGSDFVHVAVMTPTDPPGIALVALSRRVSEGGAAAGGSIAAVPFADGIRSAQDRIVLVAE
jgi:hypothetical protein